jgi:hypothetical protein
LCGSSPNNSTTSHCNPTTGYYQGKPEKSIVLDVVGAKESQVKWLAAGIREINQQASVLVITLKGRAKKITTNQ